MELDSDFDHEEDDKEGNSSVGGDKDQEEWMDENDEEDNYRYGGLSTEDSGEETDSSNADVLEEADDELGPEDGEGVENEIEVFRYSNL